MVAAALHADTASLRNILKERTHHLHESLDSGLRSDVSDNQGYASFLTIQYSARAPIERWSRSRMPAQLCPPPTASLIALDLATLGVVPPTEETFVVPEGADMRGLAWALGGSSLGNKAMLLARRRAGCDGPDHFLADTATATFFRGILPMLSDTPSAAEAECAIVAAEAVFHTFLSALSRNQGKAEA